MILSNCAELSDSKSLNSSSQGKLCLCFVPFWNEDCVETQDSPEEQYLNFLTAIAAEGGGQVCWRRGTGVSTRELGRS